MNLKSKLLNNVIKPEV